MSTILHFFDSRRKPVTAYCEDAAPVLWLRCGDDRVSVALTPRVIEQLEAVLAEGRKFNAMEAAA